MVQLGLFLVSFFLVLIFAFYEFISLFPVLLCTFHFFIVVIWPFILAVIVSFFPVVVVFIAFVFLFLIFFFFVLHYSFFDLLVVVVVTRNCWVIGLAARNLIQIVLTHLFKGLDFVLAWWLVMVVGVQDSRSSLRQVLAVFLADRCQMFVDLCQYQGWRIRQMVPLILFIREEQEQDLL